RLAGCRRATLHMLVGTTDPATIGIQLKRINERCKELGLPLAVEELPRRGKARVVQMNNAFRQRFCLLHAPSAESLESYFSSYQIAVIRYMNEHPPVRCAEMARALGVKVATVAKHLHNISSIAKAHGLPPVRHSYSVYYLPSEFLAYFGLPENSLDAKKLLEGAHQKKLYRYLRRYPLASSKQIAHHLCVSSDRVSNIRARMNVRLQKFGFAAL
ncbi:MAG TPA: hypothetical protein VJH24_01140, partial [Candidatus Bilamarchaeaceae archaeon]|nr:hypothetical protein [Candidatus Bilamarchaeaceae archaeon]